MGMDPQDARAMQRRLQAGAGAAIHHRNSVLKIIIGLLSVVLGIVVHELDVEATEAWVQGLNRVNSYIPNWPLLFQVPSLFWQQYTILAAVAILVGWGIEACLLIFVFYFNHARLAVQATNSLLYSWFSFGLAGIVLVDGITTYNYTPAIGDTGKQLLVTAVIIFLGIFMLMIGSTMIEHGIKDMRADGGTGA